MKLIDYYKIRWNEYIVVEESRWWGLSTVKKTYKRFESVKWWQDVRTKHFADFPTTQKLEQMYEQIDWEEARDVG